MRKISNRFWYALHGWSALPIWALFCFICLTGTLAVMSHEITWLVNPNARATNPEQLPAKSVAELMRLFRQAYPTSDVSSVMTYEDYMVNVVNFSDRGKPLHRAYINQYTGDIQEISSGQTFIGFMRKLHGWLLFPWQQGYSIGYYLVSAMGIVMLGSLVSGLMIYKQFWRAFYVPKLRFHQGTKTLLTDLHRLAGVWSIWFILLMSLSGIWYLVQGILSHNEIELHEYAPVAKVAVLPNQRQDFKVDLSQALQIAQQQYPQIALKFVRMPEHQRDNFYFYGSGGEIFFDSFSYRVAVNPWTGDVMQAQSPQNMNALQMVKHIVNPLHYGTFGGIWTKIVWFIFGVLLTGMSLTGCLMWRKKLVQVKQQVLSAEEGMHGAA
ncbi:PepSY-associated TM helix domain-containing protein [Shewanella algae]|uniref:PepSY-associated TM helix domain-containing protein n=1 Tax=Shewanella algae TaxID=38313 RepID=UPI000F426A6A|nr:PepSY-associated TM helix domain-containing protein [Shewanella algae]AYV14489.1 PepSY domain-containing protein [Shewanella algae]